MPHGKKYREKYRRGLQEARAAIAALQERWPQAFPQQGDLMRPLASKLPGSIAEATDRRRFNSSEG
jgi:sRNA-binding protein